METIRNYLESMFSRLPNTLEVQKAKYELAQMMEDKYTELKEEGKSDNEAVGIVISEFGNLDELAESLGIRSYMNPGNPTPTAKVFPMNEASEYLKKNAQRAYQMALAVLLCIISPVGTIFTSALEDNTAFHSGFADALSILFLFVCIAAAVGLFIAASFTLGKWEYLKTEPYCTDFATSKYIHEQKESYRTTHSLLLTVGIMLCILSAVPSAVIDCLNFSSDFLEDLSGAFVVIFIAIGVFMIVLTCTKNGGFDHLLKLNQHGTVGANFVPSQQETTHYENKTVAAIMSVFWPTITCLYLIWSFLSFDWYITWIIWPIAGIINALIKNILGNHHES